MADVVHRYKPRQPFIAFHERTQRWSYLLCHRRAGKSFATINDMVVRALRTQKRNGFYAYIAPFAGQAKSIAWVILKDAVRNLPGVKIMEGEVAVVLPNGSKIRCFGADNPDALRGLYFDGVICDEFAQFHPNVWGEILRPALTDRRGWCVFVGTPAGKSNKFYDFYLKAQNDPKFFFLELKASTSGIIPDSDIEDLKQELDPSEFLQEFECSFEAANIGSYYGTHMAVLQDRGHFGIYEPVLSKPVEVAMDIGFRDATAMWFWQYIDGQCRVIDYWEETGFDAEEVVDMLELKPYSLQTIWLPHDAMHKTFRSKKSVMDVFRAADLPVRKVPNPDQGNRVMHGVNAVRNVLRTWPIFFNAIPCNRGIEAVKNYSRKWNPVTKVFDSNPLHDQWSHGADAFRYMCLSLNREMMMNSAIVLDKKPINIQIEVKKNDYTLQQAWHERDLENLRRQSAGRARIC